MTKTKWCDYSDLPAAQCAHCRGLKPDPEYDEPSGMPWRAKFAGVCTRCGNRFQAEEWIRFVNDGYGHADAEDCG